MNMTIMTANMSIHIIIMAMNMCINMTMNMITNIIIIMNTPMKNMYIAMKVVNHQKIHSRGRLNQGDFGCTAPCCYHCGPSWRTDIITRKIPSLIERVG